MRIFVTMVGYNRHDVVRDAMQSLEDTTTDAEHRRLVKTVFLCQYPIPSVDVNRAKIIEAAKEFGWWYAEIQNQGVMANHNTALHDYCHIDDGDFYITYDPDVRFKKVGWISAMVEALQSDPTAMFCSSALDFHHHDWMQKKPYSRKVTTLPSGLKISRFDCLISWASGMWRGDFLKTRPRDFAQLGKYYGWSEHADYDRLLEHKKTWLSVTDFVDYHLGAPDAEYTAWKICSARKETELSFNEWLKTRK